MIGTVDNISLSYSGTKPIVSVEAFDGWFPHLLGETRGMQKDKCQVFIVSVVYLFSRASVLGHKVALGYDVIWVGGSRRADDGLFEHPRKKRVPATREGGGARYLNEPKPSTVSHRAVSAAVRSRHPKRLDQLDTRQSFADQQ